MDPREAAEESLELLQGKLQVFTEVKANCGQAEEHIEVQAGHTERRIKEQFEELQRFLREDEEARIAALREEQKRKGQAIREKIESLDGEISVLLAAIRAIEEELRGDRGGVTHDESHRSAAETLKDPEMEPGALIDEAKHLGNLAFRVWDEMRRKVVSYAPVVLDPNTANSVYALSEDMASVTPGEERRLPDNPERFDCYGYVLGSEGLASGVHSWDVDVRGNADWEIGVLAESYERKGQRRGPFWSVCLYDGKYTTESSGPGSFAYIAVARKPRRVRVRLDWDGGKLSFSDARTDARLHTFRHAFDGALFPYVGNGDSAVPLRMLPMRIGVMTALDDDYDDGDDEDDADYEDDGGD